ncbi:hypothetical protein HY989_00510 [Candidatus Micrarchaeota archaeon]|nr:hypothetical protein [Candidatus Micrarchaeota archaeon]
MAEFTIDQSGKWEENGDTVIGVSGTKNLALMVRARTKQNVTSFLRKFDQEKNRSKNAMQVRMFAYSIFIALRNYLREGDAITIDLEYEGQDQRIGGILISLFEKKENVFLKASDLRFERIGKQSLAHAIGLQTLRSKRKPDKTATFDDYFELMDKTAHIMQKSFDKRKKK